MNTSPENSQPNDRYVVEVKIGKKWVQCTNPLSLLEAVADKAAKERKATDCAFRLTKVTPPSKPEVPS